MRTTGKKTVGLLLLLTGIIFFIQQWAGLSFGTLFGFVWPVLVVSLIVEVMLFYRRRLDGERLVFHKGAMTLIIAAMIVSGIFHSVRDSEVSIGGSFFWMEWIDQGTSAQIDESYHIPENIDEINIEIPNARLQVEGTDSDEMTLEGTVRGSESSEEDVLNMYDDLRETASDDDTFSYVIDTVDSSWFFINNHFSADLTLSVPYDRLMDITVRNGSVNVFQIDNDVTVATTNGRIDAADIHGNFTATNTNGAIHVSDIAGAVDASTTNGRLTGTDMHEDVTFRTTNGGIDAESDELGGDWELRTTNGNINLSLPENGSAAIEGKTTNGSLRGDVDWDTRERTEGSAVIGNGTYSVRAQGTNGSVTVSLAD